MAFKNWQKETTKGTLTPWWKLTLQAKSFYEWHFFIFDGNWCSVFKSSFKQRLDSKNQQYKTNQKICFQPRETNLHYPLIIFEIVLVKRVQCYKHLGLILDSELDFHEHISLILWKVNKLTAEFWKLQAVLPRHSSLTIYTAYVRPHLNYCDMIHDKVFNEFWHKRLESAQYNVALATAEANRCFDTEKFYQEFAFRVIANTYVSWEDKLYFTKSIKINLPVSLILNSCKNTSKL